MIVADIYPFPYDTGGKQRTANLIIQMSKYYNIDFVCFSLDPITEIRKEEAKKYCRTVIVEEGAKPRILAKTFNLFRSNCNAEFIVHSKRVVHIVRDLMMENRYTAVLVERLYALQYVKENAVKYNVPIILDMHDIEREAMSYFGKISKNPLRKCQYKLETKKVIELEKQAVEVSTVMVTVSERDKMEYTGMFPGTDNKWMVVNNGVDLVKTEMEQKVKRDTETVIFVGSLRHPPNIHGLKWFVRKTWPLVVQKNPSAKFIIIGSGKISDEDKDLFNQTKGVMFKGYVDNVYPLLRKATCLVVPLFSGSGTRLKILEAFSFGLPVVSTTIGAEGLPCVDGESIMIADDERTMCDQIQRVLDSEALRQNLVHFGYEIVRISYNWDFIGKSLFDKIEQIRERKTQHEDCIN